jgi:sulfoxide reductase heme-binding subunit YedZ
MIVDAVAPAKPVRSPKPFQWLKQGIFLGGMMPLVVLMYRAAIHVMTNAKEEMLNQFGLLALICLICSLACTPLKMLFGWTWPLRVRKMLGLLAFFYAFLHFLVYFIALKGADIAAIVADVTKRPFIIVGFCAFLILIPLAITSSSKIIARMGAERWQRLHRLVYAAGILAAVHFFMRVKLDVTEPLIYGGILVFLLGVRLFYFLRRKPTRAATPTT